MRDGAVLRADVARDPRAGQKPALLMRTPYGKPEFFESMLSPVRAAERGYTVIVQDCRGSGASEGELRPSLQEIEDGYDSVEWCAAQDWCDGRVGMYGTSYMGATPWLAAIAAPPSLRAIATQMTGSDFHDGWVYEGGALQLGFNVGWIAQFLALPGLHPQGIEGATPTRSARPACTPRLAVCARPARACPSTASRCSRRSRRRPISSTGSSAPRSTRTGSAHRSTSSPRDRLRPSRPSARAARPKPPGRASAC